MSFLLKTSSDFPELFDCLNDNTAIEANANNIGCTSSKKLGHFGINP